MNLKTALAQAINPDTKEDGLAALRRIALKAESPVLKKQRAALTAALLLVPFGEMPTFDAPTVLQALIDVGAPHNATILAVTIDRNDPRWQPAAEALAAWGMS